MGVIKYVQFITFMFMLLLNYLREYHSYIILVHILSDNTKIQIKFEYIHINIKNKNTDKIYYIHSKYRERYGN
jgi:hypothetical protein